MMHTDNSYFQGSLLLEIRSYHQSKLVKYSINNRFETWSVRDRYKEEVVSNLNGR